MAKLGVAAIDPVGSFNNKDLLSEISIVLDMVTAPFDILDR